jgi:hypothetical protein
MSPWPIKANHISLMTLLRQSCVLCLCTCPNSISCYLKPKLHLNCCFQVPDTAAAGPALPTDNFENIKHDENWSQQGSQRFLN